ncbi:hypothetical protein LZK98_18475 [Sphingomonas cannabina]|uniref:hypothetical protein n=1 Tax=Sphingomonas cannabina TaxID=2899123 RepID=UPI001F38845F|nr:hypothetical protein [Sphingomonas cannabina]UIJ45013.1 hypothetical protein LZK98_18475 [Sphingomonas cannabina]
MTILATAGAALTALVALPAADAPRHPHLGAAIKAGCHVQQVHTPAGKPVQSNPIVRCPAKATAQIASADEAKARRTGQ